MKLRVNHFTIFAAWILHHFHQFLQAVSRNAIGQAIEQRRGHQNAFMDVHQVLPSSALCRPSHYNAFFYLRCDRHAGEQNRFIKCDARLKAFKKTTIHASIFFPGLRKN